MTTEQNKPMSVKTFLTKILNGTAIGVLVGLLPNAILSVLLSVDFLKGNAFISTWQSANVLFQATVPALMGLVIAAEFHLKGLKAAVLAAATYVGSGVTLKSSPLVANLLQKAQEAEQTQLVEQARKLSNSYFTVGTGDIINAMLVASLTVVVLMAVGERFGSLNIILLPITAALCASVGLLILPYTKMITNATGEVIKTFTELQPYLMSVLISVSFAVILMTPMSTVAIGLAIGLNGISAGASAMGVAATMLVLVVHSISVNKPGITTAIALGSMKMMMPNVFKYPIIYLPLVTTAALTGLFVPLFQVVGTPASAGFGLVGLTGMFASIEGGLNFVSAIIVWLAIPISIAIAVRIIFEKILSLYNVDIFKFDIQ